MSDAFVPTSGGPSGGGQVAGGGIFGSLGATSGGGGMGGANLEVLERQGRRMRMLTQYAPEFVTSSPSAALAMAEGGFDEDEMLRSASQAVDFANVGRLRADLSEETDQVQLSMWAGLPRPMQDSLRQLGYEPPKRNTGGGGRKMFGINLPDKMPFTGWDVLPDELTLPDDTPVLGPVLGGAQHAAGEGLQHLGGVGGAVLDGFNWLGDQTPHLYRALRQIHEDKQMDLGAGSSLAKSFTGIGDYFSPSKIANAWSQTDEEDDYVRPQFEQRALGLLGDDPHALKLARLVATHKTPEQIVASFGLEPQTAEAGQLIAELTDLQSRTEFRDAVHELSVGQVSFGRVVAQGMGLDDTDAGWGRLASGMLDAGFVMASDPTNAFFGSEVMKGARFGRWAFTLEDADDVARGFRLTDAATQALHARAGTEAPELLARFGPLEMRRGRQVLAWADRVAEGFSTGNLSKLGRDLPDVSTALDTMVNSNARRLANGEQTLDTAEGVLSWLKDRDGILAMAGSRIGGGSPMARGLRIPALTTRGRAAMWTKGIATDAIDWARVQYGPTMAKVLSETKAPASLSRSVGQWVVAHTAGDTGRILAGLTTHAPYKADHIALFGDDAIPEFTRLVNSGIFGGMSRSMMDDYIDAFAKGDVVTRMTQVEQFNRKLFDVLGIADTKVAKDFVERARQVYSTADEAALDPLRTRMAPLVDAHHADAMAVPTLREVLQASKKVNITRFLFHNAPASWADATMSRAWKPAVLMRIGFIPRAAGEELLHYVLKYGPRSYLGAKGADWAMQAEIAVGLENQLREAKALGDTNAINSLERQLAGTQSALAPIRSLAAATDRMWMRGWDGILGKAGVEPETSAWRRRLVTKSHNLDEKGVVSGLERKAVQLSLATSGAMRWAAEHARIPSKGQWGEFLASHWDPDSLYGARLFLDHERPQRAFAEEISGGTMLPQEFRGLVDEKGERIRRVPIMETRGGKPVMVEVELRPKPGEYQTLSRGVEQDPTFLDSIYTRHQALTRGDRVGERVVSDVLPRWVGCDFAPLPSKLGYTDHAGLRTDLNTAWSFARGEDAADGKTLLSALRDYIDGGDFEPARKKWLTKELDAHFKEAGVKLRAKPLLATIDEAGNPAKHWLAYENVNPAMLTDNFEKLQRSMNHAARARLSRPDMYRHLRESRLYSIADEPLARPVVNGISKVYVPLTADDLAPLGDDFVEAAVAHIKRIGGYSEETARRIAENVSALSDTDDLRAAAAEMTQRALSAWGASDPRVAEAISAAAEEITGVRPRIGILEVPDDAVQRAAGRNPVGLVTDADNWKIADDYVIEPWRLTKTKDTRYTRRLTQLEVDGEWWDEVELTRAREAWDHPTGKRLFTTNHRTWTDTPPDAESFWFVDVGKGVDADSPLDVINSYGPHRIPAAAQDPGWTPTVTGHQLSDGLPESSAIERVGEGAVNEALDILTTLNRTDLDDDVLHEIVEPLLRGDKVHVDEAGNKVLDSGYTLEHLVHGTKVDRLPWESYGPVMHAARDSKWSNFVSTFFDGPVDGAISAVIRKPMFLHEFGKQARLSKGVADLFVEPEIHAAAARAATKLGLDADALDTIALGSRHEKLDDIVADMVEEGTTVDKADLGAIRDFAAQRIHGLDTVRDNALNRAMQLITPFIDDHRFRSQMQQYVGNFVPFLFAEEQFLKRWSRSIAESPEMIRKAQLMMNGFRSMGVVRKDDQGNDYFVYPGVGEAAKVLSDLAAPIFGENMRIPYVVQMTGQVGYTLPGLGDQVGVPSVGPLVAMPLELLSRHFPEVSDVEHVLVQRGADQPLWRYFVPSGGAKLVDAMFGDIDSGQLASATSQAMLTMAVNGQAPAEGATPDEQQQFIERARGQARFILASRAVFGMTSPAAPQVTFRSDELNAEYNKLLAAAPIEEATAAFLAAHPDVDAGDILAATVSTSEQEFGGMQLPTERAAGWMDDNGDLIGGFPAASSWLMPQPDADDKFSHRAWTQQFALGLRRHKAPEELLHDVYFQAASRDYFDKRTEHEATMLTSVGEARSVEEESWRTWKDAYFAQHPVFQSMLADPTRIQRRQQAVEELSVLSTEEDGPVPDDLQELISRYQDYRDRTSAMRGDRRSVVENRRKALTEEFSTWALWHVQKHPRLSAAYMRLIEPDLMDFDEDAKAAGALSA
jgi:hypothetical protein